MMGAAWLVAPLLSCGSRSDVGYDTIIRDGTVYDGTLCEPSTADINICGDRIVAVGNLNGSSGNIIDARNCIVTPGFIDGHDHSDINFLSAGSDREFARTLPVWSGNHGSLIQLSATLSRQRTAPLRASARDIGAVAPFAGAWIEAVQLMGQTGRQTDRKWHGYPESAGCPRNCCGGFDG